MDDIKLKPSVEFAGGIVELAMKDNTSSSSIMTGLAIATAAMLLDMAIERDGSIDEEFLVDAEAAFNMTLRDAVGFAKRQVAVGLLITEN